MKRPQSLSNRVRKPARIYINLLALFFLLLTGCDEQIIHDLSEQDANRVLSRLSSADLGAHKVIQSDGRWAIAVPKDFIVPALSFLETNRVLSPRSSQNNLSAKGGLIPSREEQWFRYERSVSQSIEDSLAAIVGVLEARVHLNLPETDPLFGTKKAESGTGSVLLLIDQRFSSSNEDISALVGGAAGVVPSRITVLRSIAASPEQPEIIGEQVNLKQEASSEWATVPGAGVSVRTAGMGFAALGLLGAVGVAAFLRRRVKPIKFTRPGSFDSEE